MIVKEPQTTVNTPINRILYSQNNNVNGLTLVCIGGVHGNEPAGIYGLQKIIRSIIDKNVTINGNFYALHGNRSAFRKNVRFQNP